jgi:hypothetical protein
MSESIFMTRSEFKGVKNPNTISGRGKCPLVIVCIGEFVNILRMDGSSPMGYVFPNSCLSFTPTFLSFVSSASEAFNFSSFH